MYAIINIFIAFLMVSNPTENSTSINKYFPLKTNQILKYSSNFGDSELVITKTENEYFVKNTSDDFKYEQI